MYYSIGLFAHNEANNIQPAIAALLSQEASGWQLKQLVVVVSGSTDRTAAIVRRLAQTQPKLKLLVQKKRTGKVAAINLFLRHTRSRYLVLANADNLVAPNALDYLLTPLKRSAIGMTCSRIVPQNPNLTLFDYATHLQWRLHHKINLQFPERPKAGELIAVKRVFHRLNHRIATDEANLEAIIRTQGFEVRYCPQAIVYNYGPSNLSDFISQRRRIYAQHLRVRHHQGYQVVTMSHTRLLGVFLANLDWNLRDFTLSSLIMSLELLARFLGLLDYLTQTDSYFTWQPAVSTKKPLNQNQPLPSSLKS